MPRIVAFNCPHCGAALSVDADDRDVTCKFCQVKSVIHRTVERPLPQPPWPGPPPPAMPARTQASGGGSVIAVVAAVGAMLVLMGAGAAFWLFSVTPSPGPRPSMPGGAVAAPEPALAPTPSYEFASTHDGGSPLFIDANRDGTLDVLVQTGYPKRLVAFDGASGKPLWTASLEGAGFSTHVAVAESRVVVANDVSVELLDASTGQRAAKATLNDKVRRLCAPSGGKLRVHLFDNTVDTIDPSTGAVTSEAKGARCDDLFTARGLVEDTERRHYPASLLEPALGALRCGNIQVSGTWNYLWRDPCGPALRMNEAKLGDIQPSAVVPMRGGHLLLGRKARGKRTPMIGFAKGSALEWSETLSKAEPAEQPEADANRVALHGSLLGAVYPGPKGDRLALFDTGTGKRSHDVELPAPIHAIRSRGDGKLVLVGKHHIVLADGAGKLETLVGP